MFRGYRCILAAIAGLILTGGANPPKPTDQPEQPEAAGQLQEAADTIASAITNANEPPEQDAGCQDRHDKRDSDLCAQWKAADSARDAANYSAWTLLVSAIGTGLLVWTLWETRSTARRELRAYVSVKVRGVRVNEVEGKGLYFVHEIVSHNGGATPAYDCVHFGSMMVYSPEVAARELANIKPIPEEEYKGGAVVHSGEDFPVEPGAPALISFELLKLIQSGNLDIYLFGVASYVDTFGIRRRTDYCYRLPGGSLTEALKQGETDAPIPVKWNVTPFHNTAT